jgi:hypothetical protein
VSKGGAGRCRSRYALHMRRREAERPTAKRCGTTVFRSWIKTGSSDVSDRACHRPAGNRPEYLDLLPRCRLRRAFDALKRFHHNLGYGLLGRRIERSPLPFARHRWVAYQGPDIDIAESARPRDELSDWAGERAQLPVDPEWAPCWRLRVLPLTDGSTAVSRPSTRCDDKAGSWSPR